MKRIKVLLLIISLLLFSLSGFYSFAQPQTKETGNVNKLDWFSLMQDPDAKFKEVQNLFYNYWNGKSDHKGNGYKVFKRWEYINQWRVLSDGKLQAPGYVVREHEKYLQQTDIMMSAAGNWSIAGPTDYVINSTSQPTGMGRINAIAFHPTDANTIFIGAPAGGIWKTTNHGASWVNLCNNMPTLGVSSILVHPSNPDIIYIGTGDRDSDDAIPMGVFKTINGGSTWTQTSLGMGNAIVGAMMMDPTDPNTIIAATSLGIFKTTNGGSSWSQKTSGNFKDIQYHPESSTGIVYAVKIKTPSEFYKSSDLGETWSQITSGIPTSGIGSRMVIGVSEDAPDYVYLLQIKSSDGTLANILRSVDAGDNFSVMATGPNILGYNCDGSGTASQATYDLCMIVNPSDADNVFVGGINNWASSDGGVTWYISTHWIGSDFGETCAATAHADQHCYNWNPLNDNLYVGHDGGISYTEDYGYVWTEITGALPITQVYKIGQGAGSNDYIVFGCQDNGSGGATDGTTFYTTRGGDGMECLIDYNNSNYCYNTYVAGEISRSTTGPLGNYYNIASDGTNGLDESGAWVTPYFQDNTNPGTLFVGYNNVWRTDNARAASSSAVTWIKISTGETHTCKVLAQSPVDHNIVYVVRSDPWNEDATIQRTENANATPASVTWTSCTVPGDGHTPTDLKCHPTDPDIIYASVGYGVYKSEDRGMTWTDISSNLPSLFINCLVIDKNADEGIYAGNQTGVWFKNASMNNWALFSTGLPPVDVRELEIYYDANPANNRIKAGTYGRGIWQSDLAGINVLDPENFTASPVGSDQINLAWIKNPANDDVLIAWAPISTFGTPLDGISYSAGNAIPSGGTVLYKGPLTAFSHTLLTASTTYYYKIWSVNGSDQYSAGSLPVSETTDCATISSFPFTETFDNPTCWRTKDYTGQGSWLFGYTTNSTNPPTILDGTYAYLKSKPGNTVEYNSDLISPPFDFSTCNSVMLQFNQHFDTDPTWTSTATLSYTLNNGATWVALATYTTDQSNAVAVIPLAFLAGQSNVKFKWNYYDDGTGSYMWGIDNILIVDNSNYWTGTINTDWFVNGNWGTGLVPTSIDAAIIPSAPVNQPLISLPGAVCLDITIDPGASLTMSNSNSYTLSVAGDWINNGTFNRGIGTVQFIGTNPLQTIKGSSTTAFYILKVAKGAQDRILEATSLITLHAAANPMDITSGTFKLSSASTITPFTTAAGAELLATDGIWNNGGTINYGNFTWYNAGLLRISAGTINSGTGSGNSITYWNGGKTIIEGGALNIAGRFQPNSGTSYGPYTQTGGVVTVNTAGSASTSRAPFEINSGVIYTVSGGTIVIQRASSNTNGDFLNASSTATVTGGNLQIGNTSTPAGQTIRINSTVPVFNLTVSATNAPTAQLHTNGLTVLNSVTISGGTLNTNNLNLNVGGDWSNNGNFTPGSGTVTFNGSVNQSLLGTNATTFYNLTLNNDAGIMLNGSVNATVDGTLNFTSGVISTGYNKLIMGNTGIVSRTSGHIYGNFQKNSGAGTGVSTTFEIGDASASDYTPVILDFATVTTSGDLLASTVKPGSAPPVASNISQTKYLDRKWSINNTGTVFDSYNATFFFVSGDLVSGANTADFIAGKNDGGIWTNPTVGTKTVTSTEITGVTSFSEFFFGETSASFCTNTLSGTLKYNNAAKTPLNNVELTISPAGANATSTTDGNGNYSFTGLCPGDYTIAVTNINKPVGYINSTDASAVNSWNANPSAIEHVKFMAGDVNLSYTAQSTDAKAIQNYFVYTGNPLYDFDRGQWVFMIAGDPVVSNTDPNRMNELITVTVDGLETVNLYGQAVGDFNGSFVPGGLKTVSETLSLVNGETRLAGASSEVELPVRIMNSEILGAASLILNYPQDLFEVTDVILKLESGNLDWSAKGGELRIGWNRLTPLQLEAGSMWLSISGTTSPTFNKGNEIRFTLAADPLNELADGNNTIIPDAKLAIEVLAFSTTGTPENEQGTMYNEQCKLSSRPNPFSGYSIVDFRLPMEGHVTLEITDILGRRVALLVDEYKSAGEYSLKLDATPLQPGVYMATVKLQTANGDFVKTIKMVRER